jgi:hypothetical protein
MIFPGFTLFVLLSSILVISSSFSSSFHDYTVKMSSPVEVYRAMQFFEIVGKLKQVKRTGWVNHGRNSLY